LTTAWFDEQQRLTLAELQTARFPLSRMGRRGYEEEPVDRFLRSVQAEFVHLVNERASLWQEVQRLRQRILVGEAEQAGEAGEAGEPGEAGGDRQAVLFGEAEAHLHAVRILSTAQVTADRYVADAQAYISRITEQARRRRDRLMQEVQQRSDMILEDAQARAREAAVSALNLPAPPQTDRERLAAQAELAYLRTYSDFYRAHLRAYTEGMLRGIEEWERKEAASFQEAVPGPADWSSGR
jgi:DivIVA domain-containing protein